MMRAKTYVWLALLAGLGLSLAMAGAAEAQSREARWKRVEEAESKGLPKTAIAELVPLQQEAARAKAYGEAVKALARRVVLEANIQGGKPEERIPRLEAEIAPAPAEMKPLLEALLAHWYWQYFQQNRWRFMQRTLTAEAPGSDFTTWDLGRLFEEIDRHFERALASPDFLRRTPIGAFDALLEKGSLPDACRPTLYDFLVNDALAFYTSAEQAAAKPENAFELPAESPVLGPVAGFLAWSLPPEQAGTPVGKAIRWHQELLRFHQQDTDRLAFAEADFARLNFGFQVGFGEEKSRRYLEALTAFANAWGDFEVSARARHSWAQVLREEKKLVEARRVALVGAEAFKTGPGGKLCRNLVNEIEARSVQIATERVWNAPWPTLAVSYRNVTNLHFRVVASDWGAFLRRNHRRPEQLSETERKELLAMRPALAWSTPLPPTLDYRERVHEVPAPTNLPPGFYFVFASHRPDFAEADNCLGYTDVWVSDLAVVVRGQDRKLEGFVLWAKSGEPIAGAEVMGWSLDRSGNRVPTAVLKTDTNGFFAVGPVAQQGYLLRARYQGQELGSRDEYRSYPEQAPRAHAQTVLFTDRALYRPGQTIQYKGIVLRVDPAKNNYQTLAGRRIELVFADTNGKEVARVTHQANEWGSFSGSVTAPADRLAGMMSLRVEGEAPGATAVRVEEYKRPKFHVTLESPVTAPKLDEVARVQGKAESYTGAAVDGAMVKYRVVREVRWPRWWIYFHPPTGGSQEIAHGSARTAADGSFQIEFLAKPDPTASARGEAIFNYTVFADVTDVAGETRSAQRSIAIGRAALQIETSAADWLVEDQPVEVNLTATTLDGEPQVAEGVVRIHRLREPERPVRPPFQDNPYRFRFDGREVDSMADPSDPNAWELGELVTEQGFTTDAKGQAKARTKLGTGYYRALVESRDRFGQKVVSRCPLRVLNPSAGQLSLKTPCLVAAPSWSVEPGQEFMALWGTGYDTGRAFVEFEHRHRVIESYWTSPGRTQQHLRRAVTEALRGGFTLRITSVRENRAYLEERQVVVPWSNKDLEIKWEHFVSKLAPGQKETWTAIVTGPNAQKAVAEMVATLYDASLDAYVPHDWQHGFGFFERDYSSRPGNFLNGFQHLQMMEYQWSPGYLAVSVGYRHWPSSLLAQAWRHRMLTTRSFGGTAGGGMRPMNAPVAEMAAGIPLPADAMEGRPLAKAAFASPAPAPLLGKAASPMDAASDAGMGGGAAAVKPAPDLNQVSARKNLRETAFFFPHLVSDKDGVVRITFTMPEALTQWRFLAFAHDRECRTGFLEDRAVTAKDLMVEPNPPRFLREGDVLEFTVKVSNQSAAAQTGKVRLTFADAATDAPADSLLGNGQPEQAFEIPAKESRSYSWRIQVPDGCGFLKYKAVGSTGRLSDGEEGYVPVLSRRILLTESMPLPVRGPGTAKFSFAKLLASAKSGSLKHQRLVVQMTSQPAWYAVLALPYLMEYPHECAEQVFNRFYANALGRLIATSDPKIQRVFEQWRGTPALDSPLLKNPELKAVMVEETPWLREANQESQARRNVGVLFDENRLNAESERALKQLSEMQLADGLWPWFPGGRGNEYITLYLFTGFGRLRHLGVDVSMANALKALPRLDRGIQERYQELLKSKDKEEYVPGALDALYLYGRSFYLKEQPVPAEHREAVEYFLNQARRHWVKVGSRQSQGHLALAFKRWGGEPNLAAASAILASLKERSVNDPEMGMYWRDTEGSWWWYRAPIETQALMIEAFDEVGNDRQAVEDCRVWLLKQKQTQDWRTTKATADAVYALLLRGRDLLASDALVEVSLGRTPVRSGATREPGQPAIEAGTGYYERSYGPGEIQAAMGEVVVKKSNEGVAWGGLHWQYLEDMAKVTPHTGTPLQLKKALFTKVASAKGPVLEPVRGTVKVGDELVVRIELRVDRDLEYVHLKDQRGSGLEPVNVLSGYRYRDGLAYYESTRDTASHFFLEYVPKGTYVFEYSTRVRQRGRYQSGVAEIQCLYAPEFNSHSESLPIQAE